MTESSDQLPERKASTKPVIIESSTGIVSATGNVVSSAFSVFGNLAGLGQATADKQLGVAAEILKQGKDSGDPETQREAFKHAASITNGVGEFVSGVIKVGGYVIGGGLAVFVFVANRNKA